MTTVTIGLRYGRTFDGEKVTPPRDTVDLDRLSPRARALALAVAASLGAKAGPIWIECDRPYGESWEHRSEAERAAYADPARDSRPVRQQWDAWDRWYADATEDPYWYLERQAHKLPAGWHIIGPDIHAPVAGPEQPMEDWTAEQAADHLGVKVVTVRKTLQRLGVRPYRHEPAPGGGVRGVYSAAAVRAAHASRPGRGARTDLKPQDEPAGRVIGTPISGLQVGEATQEAQGREILWMGDWHSSILYRAGGRWVASYYQRGRGEADWRELTDAEAAAWRRSWA